MYVAKRKAPVAKDFAPVSKYKQLPSYLRSAAYFSRQGVVRFDGINHFLQIVDQNDEPKSGS